MKKSLIALIAVMALAINMQADFNIGNMFKDMKEAAITASKDAKKSVEREKDNTKKQEDNALQYTQEEQNGFVTKIQNMKAELRHIKNNNNALKNEVLALKKKNKSLHMSLTKSEIEKTTFYQYVGFFIGMIVLLFISLLIFWFLSIKKCNRKLHKKGALPEQRYPN